MYRKGKTVKLKGFGFPVVFIRAIFRDAGGDYGWVLDVNENDLQSIVLAMLLIEPFNLLGKHVKFIRQSCGMNREAFAEKLNVSAEYISMFEHIHFDRIVLDTKHDLSIRLLGLEVLKDYFIRTIIQKGTNNDPKNIISSIVNNIKVSCEEELPIAITMDMFPK